MTSRELIEQAQTLLMRQLVTYGFTFSDPQITYLINEAHIKTIEEKRK